MLKRIREWWGDFNYWTFFRVYWWKNGWRRAQRFWVWVPVIWKDRDWDAAFLFEIMRVKISMMRKDMERSQRHLGWEKDCRNMRIAEEILKRQGCDDFYYENDKKNKQFCICPKDRIDLFRHNSDGTTTWIWESCPFCRATLKRQDQKEDADFQFLMNHLRRHVRKWWN